MGKLSRYSLMYTALKFLLLAEPNHTILFDTAGTTWKPFLHDAFALRKEGWSSRTRACLPTTAEEQSIMEFAQYSRACLVARLLVCDLDNGRGVQAIPAACRC